MKNISILIKTSRPLSWILAPMVFLMGLLASGGELSFLSAIQGFLLAFPYCILLYGINDVYDYKSDMLNPRKNLVEGIILKPKHHQFVKKTSFFVALILILTSLLTFNATNLFGMVLLLFFSYFYSAPPLRFKVKPPLDSFANGILYFFAPFIIGFSFNDALVNIPIKVYLIAICVMGIHSFSTIMDYSVDKKIGDKTFSGMFGKRFASLFAFIAFIFALSFAGINTVMINYYLIFCSILFLIVSIFPSERLASVFFKLIFLGFIVTSIMFLI